MSRSQPCSLHIRRQVYSSDYIAIAIYTEHCIAYPLIPTKRTGNCTTKSPILRHWMRFRAWTCTLLLRWKRALTRTWSSKQYVNLLKEVMPSTVRGQSQRSFSSSSSIINYYHKFCANVIHRYRLISYLPFQFNVTWAIRASMLCEWITFPSDIGPILLNRTTLWKV